MAGLILVVVVADNGCQQWTDEPYANEEIPEVHLIGKLLGSTNSVLELNEQIGRRNRY